MQVITDIKKQHFQFYDAPTTVQYKLQYCTGAVQGQYRSRGICVQVRYSTVQLEAVSVISVI